MIERVEPSRLDEPDDCAAAGSQEKCNRSAAPGNGGNAGFGGPGFQI
jgi:hypothetical protein